MISDGIMNLLMEMITFSFVIPIAFIIVWKLRTRKSLVPVFVGASIFFVAANVLESIPHTLFLRIDSPISRFLTGNPWAYALYGGVMAALFEETARYLAFKFFLAKYPGKETAVSYGLGHGGLECMIILGIGHIQNYTYCQLINAGKMDDMIKSLAGNESAVKTYQDLVKNLTELKVSTIMWGGVERLSALFLQVALSVMVYYAVKQAGKIKFLWIAMALHTLVDFVAAFYQAGVVPLFVVELCIIIITAGACRLALQMYRSLPADPSTVTKKTSWKAAKARYTSVDTDKDEKKDE